MFSGDNLLYLLTMLEAIGKTERYVATFEDADQFFNADDQLYFHAATHLVLAVGEESKKLEEGLKRRFPEVPWKAMAGMRNRLAHDYRGIDFNLVFSVVKTDLPLLKSVLIKMLPLIAYSKDELDAALNSPFYKHLAYLK